MATEYIKTIECSKCRFKNVAGTKFCGDCGTALGGSPIPCGTCGTENPSGTKFCGNCGGNLQNPQENDPDVRHLQDALRGKYVIQKPLGEGVFGRVFLAEHSGLWQKHVIKLLSADSSRSTDIRNRFFQEAQLIARLKHPNIVPIMDVAEYLGRPYYIMSYLNGGSLEDLLQKEKKLSTEKALEITSKILSALSEVHSKGIIHRDLKPNNVLLNESGEPILIDFGIARVEEGGKAKTGTGFSIGTPVYMSPEQLDAKPISLTTDIYSMGIMLYELLTGKPPFEGSMSSLITQHNTAKLPSVSGKIDNSKLADGIQAVLQKACAKEPSARYSSAKEMREAVLGLIQAKPKPNPEWEKKEAEHKRREEELRKKEEELQARERVVVQERKVEVVKATPVLENPSSSKTYTNSLGMEFVLIPAGEFMMGAVPQDSEAKDNEKPQHKVRITKPFYMGKYPVTQEEWEMVIGNNPSWFKQAGKKAPVDTVSWNDCQEFIKKLGKKEGKTYRLPTEAEWEYGARGGGSTSLVGEPGRTTPTGSYVYTHGDDAGKFGDYAWYTDNSGNTTHPVGQKKPNSIGLYDMMGNVWEWCEDWYGKDYYKNSLSVDPKGAKKGGGRSLRGGSWDINDRRCRLSYRINLNPDNRNDYDGFRLIRNR
jgi:formylglycine-generating enzyme required for sulfatase activity/predicted Ser/Thr protein kinase